MDNLINNLVASVEKAERRNQSFYRRIIAVAAARDEARITVASTPSTPATSRYEADNCEHCHASYGHTRLCPTLNRNVAEAISALHGDATETEKILAHGLGVSL